MGLAWKRDRPELKENYQQAEKRLRSTERSLRKDPKKAAMYNSSMEQYIKGGFARAIEDVDEEAQKCRYLPHHAVFREDRMTTKCRVVFDANAKTPDGVSLNSCLLKGPIMQHDCSNGRHREDDPADKAEKR